MTREVDFRKGHSRQDGFCNGCHQHATPEGITEHRVWIVAARGALLRFCDDCRTELALQMSEAAAHEKRKR